MTTGDDLDFSARISKTGKIKFAEGTFALTSTRRLDKLGIFGAAIKYVEYYIRYLIGSKGIDKKEYGAVR